jgi:hypothetical protein
MQTVRQITRPETKPPPFQHVIAETSRGRYVSHVDEKGNWVRVTNGSILRRVRNWYPIHSGPSTPTAREAEIQAEGGAVNPEHWDSNS